MKGGAPRYKPRTRAAGALFLFLVLLFLFLFLFARLLLQSWRLRLFVVLVLRSRLGKQPDQGGTDGRRGSAGCVVDLRVWTRSAGEGSPAARGGGARRDHADGRGREDSTVPKGSPYFLFGFLSGCCGAVSCK